jgi:hypothetical protein
MANVFKKAALAFGRWTGLHREDGQLQQDEQRSDAQLVLLEPVAVEAIGEQGNPIDDLIDAQMAREQQGVEEGGAILLPPPDGLPHVWDEAQTTTAAPATVIASDPEAAIATGELTGADVTASLVVATETAVVVEPRVDDFIPAAFADAGPAEIVAPVVETLTAPIEMKPEPMPAPLPTAPADPALAFTQLYEMISSEVTKRTDTTVAVYERLLAVTREELEGTRRNNRVAWSVGGVMTAVAAFGAIWSAGEVASTRGEIGNLKQQVSASQQFAAERDALRAEMLKVSQANAKLELGSLKARLDEALALSADRDRLRGEVETLRKANQQAEGELKVARAAAATQPVSYVRPVSEKVITAARSAAASITGKAVGAERQDVWSVLLNGNSDD